MNNPERKVTLIPAKPMAERQAMKRQLRVAAYCRVSTEEEEQQSSYEAQCSYYTDKIMTNPEWTMAGIFADEGITGTSTKKRENFNRMIRKCRQKKIDLILTKSISRFARNTVDCLKYIRALRELGIGVCFEKENINTLEMDTELMLTFMGAFAQAESESISENVKWGKRQAIREGNVFVNFKRLYGYTLNENGEPEIEQEKAEVIRSIFDWYLAGDSLRMIKQRLEDAGIPNPSGAAEWKTSAIKTILANEKYCGDALGQKTFKDNVMSGKIVKNTGQLPMVLVQNNHPAIVSRETYQKVQAELARRNAGRSPSQKSAPTGRSCYASKYALSERLVCGECGTLYRRCSWKGEEKPRIVWRCVSRLDYGKKYCHNSPTMHEEPLQQAILEAINSAMQPKDELVSQITDAMAQEIAKLPGSDMTLGEIQRRLEELNQQFDALLGQAENVEKNAAQFKALSDEMANLKSKQEAIASQLRQQGRAGERFQKAAGAMARMDHQLTEWDEAIIRQLVHTVKVISADCIQVVLTDGTEVEQKI